MTEQADDWIAKLTMKPGATYERPRRAKMISTPRLRPPALHLEPSPDGGYTWRRGNGPRIGPFHSILEAFSDACR